jgi:hypothetical protein
MKFELKPNNRNLSDEELLSDVNKVAKQLDKDSVTLEEYNERGRVHSTTLTRRFGSWFKVLSLAGLKKSRSLINIPEEELFQNLEEVWKQLGRQPSYSDIQKPLSKYSVGTYEKRFGTWRKALEKFVDFINHEGQFSTEESIKQLKTEPKSHHKTKRSINWRLRFLVMRRDNFKCVQCGRAPATDPKIVLHVDHIKAWANGGETVLENLQTLCSKCNIGKSDL